MICQLFFVTSIAQAEMKCKIGVEVADAFDKLLQEEIYRNESLQTLHFWH
jgi:hypothetical protein